MIRIALGSGAPRIKRKPTTSSMALCQPLSTRPIRQGRFEPSGGEVARQGVPLRSPGAPPERPATDRKTASIPMILSHNRLRKLAPEKNLGQVRKFTLE